MHLITGQLNQLSIVYILHVFFFASTYRIRSAIFKRPARFTPVSFDRQDRRTPARHPGSNKATGRVSKGYASQQAYACNSNKVLPWIFTCNTVPILTALKMHWRMGLTSPLFMVHVYVITISNEKEVLKCAPEMCHFSFWPTEENRYYQ